MFSIFTPQLRGSLFLLFKVSLRKWNTTPQRVWKYPAVSTLSLGRTAVKTIAVWRAVPTARPAVGTLSLGSDGSKENRGLTCRADRSLSRRYPVFGSDGRKKNRGLPRGTDRSPLAKPSVPCPWGRTAERRIAVWRAVPTARSAVGTLSLGQTAVRKIADVPCRPLIELFCYFPKPVSF